MEQEEQIKKLKIIKKSENKLIDNILKYEKEKNYELLKLINRKPQKVHQIYRTNAVLIHEDEEKFSSFFPLMNNYNRVKDNNLFKYNEKKEENKNFLKKYIGYKSANTKICKDDAATLYSHILPLYNKKNYFFSNKFLSGKKIFQQSGLLIQSQRHLNEYYKKVEKRIFNKGMRDVSFLNRINMLINDKIEKNKMKELEKEYMLLEKYGKIKKEDISERLERYKRTKEYKLHKKMEAMKALDLFIQNEKDIENDKKYIQKITNLIETEEKERQKEMESTKNSKIIFNYENENNNSLFILNRYQNNKYNNKINASSTLQKNKSSTNIQSTLYKDTINSTNNNYETKQTILNNRKINKRNSIKTNIDFSEISVENNDNDTFEKRDTNEYISININQTSNRNNPINIFPKTKKLKKISVNNSSEKFESNNLTRGNFTLTKCEKNENLSTISLFNKSDIDSLIKTGRRGHNFPIRNFKLSQDLTKCSEKPKEKKNKINISTSMNYNSSMDDITKGDLRWNLFKDFNNINNIIFFKNNRIFKRFCDKTADMPKSFNDKVEKSFEYDEELKRVHIDYIKLLMKQKISKYFDKDI